MEKVDFSLTGRVALLTGAARGIGLAIARALAGAGAAVAIQDLDLDAARAEANSILRQGGRAVALGGDLRDVEQAPAWIEQTVEQLGGLHLLVNNGAIQQRGPWTEISLSDAVEQYRANVLTPLALCQRAVEIFRPQRFGRIINIGSIQQRAGSPEMLGYSMTKSAIENMTRALSRDLGRDGITVNLIAPGYFDTWRNRNDFTSAEEKERRGQGIPVPRVGEPRDCAGAALLLCSDAGSYITGQTLYIDGGLGVR